ncbi:putative gustatory receptor 22b [Bactrocera dorsalis]|uniref:Gustatory receptor n=1 Tax=Bactrocera dorsalis TaxID=27457 RepID=A0ABM3K659_BACDO|nr:putative gustatory receptor 22b [Bactrocera dorsalis]
MPLRVIMWSRFRVGLSRLIVNATVRLSIIFGILPYGYNARRRRFVTKNYYFAYSTLIDVVLIVLALRIWYSKMGINRKSDWSLMTVVLQLLDAGNLNILIVILWTNWKEYDAVLDMFNEFETMESSYFEKHKYLWDNCAPFHNYLACRAFLLLLNNILTVYVYKALTSNRIDVLIIATLANVLELAVLQFYTVVLVIYRNIWTLQQRLKHLASCGMHRRNVDNLWREIGEIAGVYLRLQRLSKRSNSIYGKHVFLYISAIVGDNISKAFLLLVLYESAIHTRYSLYIFFLVVIHTVEFWLIIAACELTLNAAYDFSQLLRSFNECMHLDDKSEREVHFCSNHIFLCSEFCSLIFSLKFWRSCVLVESQYFVCVA